MTRVDLKASARQKEVGDFTAYAGQMRSHAVFIMVRPVRLPATSWQPLKTSSDELMKERKKERKKGNSVRVKIWRLCIGVIKK